MMRKSLWMSISLTAGALVFTVATALAVSNGAHFFSATGTVDGSGALVVSWDEAGVDQDTIAYTLTASAAATYACINGGGNHPRAANKETVAAQVSTGGSFQAKNGRIRASLVSGPLSAGDFSCPPGQTLVLACVSYSSITLADTTSANMPVANIGNVSRTFVAIKGCP